MIYIKLYASLLYGSVSLACLLLQVSINRSIYYGNEETQQIKKIDKQNKTKVLAMMCKLRFAQQQFEITIVHVFR